MGQNNTIQIDKINFREYPYRGVFTRAGEKLGITAQNVRSAFSRQNPDVIKAVVDEIAKVNKIIKNGHKVTKEANGFTTISNN